MSISYDGDNQKILTTLKIDNNNDVDIEYDTNNVNNPTKTMLIANTIPITLTRFKKGCQYNKYDTDNVNNKQKRY